MRFIRSFKLSNWCLQVIVDNLNLIMRNENIPKKYKYFLFRVYSKEIYRIYSNLNSMTEESVLWFLNQHNKKITLPFISKNIITRLLAVGSVVTSLTLYQSIASERMLNSILCCIPHVTYLDLVASLCSDSTLLCIQKMCPHLVTLNLNGCQAVTNTGMQYLFGNKSLKNLSILRCNVDKNGLCTVLKGMPSLQCLKFEDLADALYDIHENDLKTKVYENIKYNLAELEYSKSYTEDSFRVIWAWTVLCPNVRKVYFDSPVENKILELCARFQNLEEIKIRMPHNVIGVLLKFTDFLPPILSIANNLKKLILTDVEISVITLLKNCPNLNSLYLKRVSFFDFKEEDIKIETTHLDTIAIRDINVELNNTSYKSIAILISLSKNVTKLYLNLIKNLSQELFQIIINSMKKLTLVDFSYSEVKLSSINCFFKMPSLRKMYCDLCIGFSLNEDPTIMNSMSDNCCTLSWRILNDNVIDYV